MDGCGVSGWIRGEWMDPELVVIRAEWMDAG